MLYLGADLADAAAVAAALQRAGAGFEYVVNCGGYVDHRLFSTGGRALFEAHCLGAMNLVQALDRSALRSFVNIGSSDEYGGAPSPQSETQREAPISPYALGKSSATQLLQMLHRTEGLPAATLRLFLTYGPGQDTKRFVPQIVQACLEGRSFPASGGEQLRDFCFVDDTVDAIFAALETEAARGEVINVASGIPVRIRDALEQIRAIVGRGTPRFGELPYRPGENMALYANVAKAKAVLGWTARIPLEEGLRRVISSMSSAGVA